MKPEAAGIPGTAAAGAAELGGDANGGDGGGAGGAPRRRGRAACAPG